MLKSVRDIRDILGDAGFEVVEFRQRKHFVFACRHVETGLPAQFVMAHTPGSPRTIRNFTAHVRRTAAGLKGASQ